MSFNIAIDGPAGAGKSTIAKAVAARLGFVYVDTGAMYRTLALHFLRKGFKSDEQDKIVSALDDVVVKLSYADGAQQVYLNDENVTSMIRTEEVGNMASASSVYGPVRQKLLSLQRDMAATTDVIMDGRDIGTHILPNAQLKIYLTASSSERAKRRYLELTAKGLECDLEAIEKDIIERDYRDMNRDIAPLKQAEDAHYLDTSDMSIEQVIESIIKLYEQSK